MKKENCILISEYKSGKERVEYEYNGTIYQVRLHDWLRKDRPSRPHLNGGNRDTKEHQTWTQEKVQELFNKEDCELVDEYHSTKQKLKYRYHDLYYWTRLDDWIHHKSRPHLRPNQSEEQFKKFLEQEHYEYETQKTFYDLKSEKKYVLRFDFYIKELNILVEIDDKSHFANEEQVRNGKMKDEYCLKNGIKLLRIDYTTPPSDYDKSMFDFQDENLVVVRYGRRYKNYNGKFKEIIQ